MEKPDAYAEFKKENKNTADTKDPTDQDEENVNYQEEIKRLKEENAKGCANHWSY